jgi:thiol:disulfide interchange protein DsbC
MRIPKLGAAALALPLILAAQSAASAQQADPLAATAREAESELRQTFTNLKFEDF